jgi:hypothetical protein
MRRIATGFLLFIFLSAIAFAWLSFSERRKRATADHAPQIHTIYKAASKEFLKLQSKAVAAKAYVKQNCFDSSFCFLIDMSLPANDKRFFIYDFKKDTVLISGLVTHGNCNQYWLKGRKYGNEIGCGCTSLGKYKIGNSYYGRFGLAFKLHGLDNTNSNAFRRYVVLHSHDCVPDSETAEEICQSNGCPTVSPNFLKQLEPVIKSAKKPVLLWVFE